MRNSNGYGSIVCLDKTGKKRRNPWAVRVTVGWTSEGKQLTKYVGYYKTRTDAQLALAKFHMDNVSLDANTVTFDELYRQWDEKVASNLTERNRMAYASAYRLVSVLHNKKLKDIKTVHLQNALDAVDKKASTKNKIKTLYNQMYDYAIQNDLAMKNYAEFVKINVSQDVVGKAFSKEDIDKLWTLADENSMARDILILIYTGMRIGEAIELPMENVNFEDGYIDLKGTKTKAAVRVIPIHDEVRPLLKKRIGQRRLFESPSHTNWVYGTFFNHFNAFINEVGINYRIHDTRKTFITYAMEAGVPLEVVRSIAGHAQQGVTAAVYYKPNIEYLSKELHKMSLR